MNLISILSVVFVGICAASCMGRTMDAQALQTAQITHSIEEVIKGRAGELMSLPGVVGVGQGLCDNIPCIKVYLNDSSHELDNKIPAFLEGYKVSIETIGEIRAHPEN